MCVWGGQGRSHVAVGGQGRAGMRGAFPGEKAHLKGSLSKERKRIISYLRAQACGEPTPREGTGGQGE